MSDDDGRAARPHESLWLWTGATFAVVGAALIAVAGGLDAVSKVPYSLATSAPMIVAYVMFGLAAVCLACAARGVPFPFAVGGGKDRRPALPSAGSGPSAEEIQAVRDSAEVMERLRYQLPVGRELERAIKQSGAPDSRVPGELTQKIIAWEKDVETLLARRDSFRQQFQAGAGGGQWNPFTATVADAYKRIGLQ